MRTIFRCGQSRSHPTPPLRKNKEPSTINALANDFTVPRNPKPEATIIIPTKAKIIETIQVNNNCISKHCHPKLNSGSRLQINSVKTFSFLLEPNSKKQDQMCFNLKSPSSLKL